MNQTPEEKATLLFETAKRSMLAAEALLNRLTEDLSSLERDINDGINIEDRAAPPLLAAVTFIDFAHRFGTVVDALPLISKKAPEIRQLTNALASVVAARNHLQHMRTDLSSNEEIDYPLLGTLMWSNGGVSYTMFLSQPTKTNTYSMVYDARNGCWVAKHQYQVKNTIIDLDAVLEQMRNTYTWIVSRLKFSDSEFPLPKWGKTQAFAFRITVNNTEGGSAPTGSHEG